MANRGKRPVRLTGLTAARAHWGTMHPKVGDLPSVFTADFRDYNGPAGLGDGRLLRATFTPAELASMLEALPVLTMADNTDNYQAFLLVVKMLRGEPQ